MDEFANYELGKFAVIDADNNEVLYVCHTYSHACEQTSGGKNLVIALIVDSNLLR